MGLKEESFITLNAAYADAQQTINPTCTKKDFIDFIINNTHLTYKYVLFTAILAKATDESLNALCLQKKSKLPGAYDARTICHKVIVPFEMKILDKALGGSNEPFLNKPARFPELSKTNAVRRGNDQTILNSLCDNLPLITTSVDAYKCLVYLLSKLINIKKEKSTMATFTIEKNTNLPAHLIAYMEKALEHSYEGEILTLLVAGTYHLMYNELNASVDVHPVNQSGASSREISDLDIYVEGSLVTSNELKDKNYTETDVRHAADKVLSAGGTKMLFIEGPRANAQGNFTNNIENEYLNKNFLLRIISYKNFLSSIIGSINKIDTEEFLHFIITTAQNTKFKDETITYLIQLANVFFCLNHQENNNSTK